MALAGLKVIEIAGLAPAPFAGKVLADFGADVVRVDRSTSTMNLDVLAQNKRSIALNLKSPAGIEALIRLCEKADVVIEPFRPGVMERLGLGPEVLLKRNPRLIYARMTGFGQEGHYAKMAGHDINYLAISGVLNERSKSGKGQVVDAAMINGVNYLGSFVYNMNKAGALFQTPAGTGQLDGGAHFYDTYKTKDGLFMAVGAIEVEFYKLLLKGLELDEERDKLPEQTDSSNWPKMKALFTKIFLGKTQAEWIKIFDLTDACVTPVLDYYSMPTPTPAPRLLRTPAKASASNEGSDVFLEVGGHSKDILAEAGFSEVEIRDLVAKKAVAGAGLEKSSL
ncbi:hypothetical protein BGZ95_005108 [Linnemannia exigua]|uniref:Alpha-methylacyl-CoA racemase n=1 Tax=Linnemannia exigua TaxID=604196 RepID=A0AAD4DHD9_9FUNG|nr:hypothetical protein BGZ95_005108 [Linnemannia exigua]